MKSVSFYLDQDNAIFAFASYQIKENENESFKIDNNKLSQTITKSIFKRYEAHKSGIKTGLKTNKPFNLSILIDNKKVLDLEELTVSTGMENTIKINTSLYKKDPSKAKERFFDTVLYVLESNELFNEDVIGCVE